MATPGPIPSGLDLVPPIGTIHPAGASSSVARRISVVLIDDDEAAPAVGALLADAAPDEFALVQATPATALAYLQARGTDCVVVALAGAEDVSIVAQLASHAPSVAVVALIDRSDEELGAATIQAGALDYLAKPALDGTLLARSLRQATQVKRLETSLAEAQSIARVGSWEVDLATNRAVWSRELYRVFDFELDQEPTYDALLARTHPDDRAASRLARQAALTDLQPFVLEHRLTLSDGTLRWVRSRARVELDAAGSPERLLGTTQDITDQRAAEDAVVHQSLHDPLTGLPNLRLFLDRLGQALSRLIRQPSTVGVIYIDIDRFKVINDSLGHPAGDQLLLAIAARLAGVIRPGDTLAHAGGDEFVVLCEGLAGEADTVAVADRCCAAMVEPLGWDGGNLVITVSAGISLTTSAAIRPDSLLRDAEAAMRQAKSQGRARAAVFAESMRVNTMGRLSTEMALRQAVRNDELLLHYQPIVDVADGTIVGHEALVRWVHPTRGQLSPDQFITIAEETGLIIPVGAWVLREACLQAKRFQSRDPQWSSLTMAVNLSGRQLGQPDLLDLVAGAIAAAGLRPGDLELEMTESVLMDDAPANVSILQSLADLGVRLSIDDFGTGYSSLAYLKRFPVDVLKIDRSFIRGLGFDLEDSAIVAAVVSLADTLGLSAIAEGVETARQRAFLVDLGCPRAQGYLFARPVAAAVAEDLLDVAALDTLSRRAEEDRQK